MVLVARWLNDDVVSFSGEQLWLGTDQRQWDELTLNVLETKNVTLWEVEGVLERLERLDEFLQRHILVEKDVLHLVTVFCFECVH